MKRLKNVETSSGRSKNARCKALLRDGYDRDDIAKRFKPHRHRRAFNKPKSLVELESDIWQRLPEEILLKVVEEHLPLLSLCCFRSVCRAFGTPKLAPGLLRSGSLCLCNGDNPENILYLYDREAGELYELGQHGLDSNERYSPLNSSCINGLFGFVSQRGDGDIVVLDLFLNSWTPLLPRPPAPVSDEDQNQRDAIFVAMGKKPNASGSNNNTRLGGGFNLEDYFFVVAMARSDFDEDSDVDEMLYTDFILQVFSGGEWCSSNVIPFPAGYTFMEHNPYLNFTLLHGSVFYFLVRSLTSNSVKLCYVEVLTKDAQQGCNMVESRADVMFDDNGFLTHIALGVCSGKVLLVHSLPNQVHGGYWKVTVQMLDDGGEKLKVVSHVLLDRPTCRLVCGGNEVLYQTDYIRNYDFRYNVLANKWEKVAQTFGFGFLRPMVCA